MRKFYFYKLTVDDGGAPCVERGLLSLAICKPMLRSSADKDDVVFGFAANSLSPDNRLIYIAAITDKLCGKKYYHDNEYRGRGDRIYHWTGKTYVLRKGAKHHEGSKHLEHDLGKAPEFNRANVLLSRDFRYFGGSPAGDYKQRFPALEKAIKALGRGHRVHHDPGLASELERLKAETWRKHSGKELGSPSQPPRGGASHRSAGCGVVTTC